MSHGLKITTGLSTSAVGCRKEEVCLLQNLGKRNQLYEVFVPINALRPRGLQLPLSLRKDYDCRGRPTGIHLIAGDATP